MKFVIFAVIVLLTLPLAGEVIRPGALMHGITIRKQKRLMVRDIRVGGVSVRYLFSPIEEKPPSTFEYYVTTASHSLTIRVAGPEQLRTLLETMALQRTTKLEVVLRDDRDTFLRGSWRFDETRFNRIIRWTIEETPCEQITHIVYSRVRNAIREQLSEGTSERRIALNEVFDILLHEDIDSFIRTLDPVRGKHACFETFHLYQWLKGEQVAGFGFGEYELSEGMRASLRAAADALLEMRRDWQRYQLHIRIVGYADASQVEKEKVLRAAATGVKVIEPFEVRYSGCTEDKLDAKKPRYLKVISNDGLAIKERIVNNCQLGAVRAYVALAYFAERLGRNGVEYEYATGGVHPLAKKRDDAHRKLDIELEVRAASDTR